MKTALAALLLCVLPALAEARPTPYPPTDTFAGDRYVGRLAQGASARDVTRSVRAHRQRHRGRYRAPRTRYSAPLTVVQGMTREAGRAVSGRPRAWCGWWLGKHLGMHDRRLWLARNWATVGARVHGPQVGAVVVWRHHVGKITAVDGHRIKVLSGNDGRAVRDRWRTVHGVIAYRIL